MREIKNVLVTGAGGTVGGYVVGELLKKGYKVVATDLSSSKLRENWNEYWISCQKESNGTLTVWLEDLVNKELVKNMFRFEKPDAIIHTAALIDVSLPREMLMKINYDSVQSLYEFFAENNGKIFVFLSSGSIYGKDGILSENSVVSPASDYEKSKVKAEKFLGKVCAKNKKVFPQAVTLRPSLIYGPCNKFLAANYLGIAIILAELLKTKTPRFCLGPKTNLVHSEDVARAAVFLMENKKTWIRGMNNKFNICDDSPLGFGEHLSAIIEACDYKTLNIKLPLPPAVMMKILRPIYESFIFINSLNGLLKGIWKEIIEEYNLKEGFIPEISRAMTPFWCKDTIFSNKKIKSQGFKLKYPNFQEGIKDVARWYKKERWIP